MLITYFWTFESWATSVSEAKEYFLQTNNLNIRKFQHIVPYSFGHNRASNLTICHVLKNAYFNYPLNWAFCAKFSEILKTIKSFFYLSLNYDSFLNFWIIGSLKKRCTKTLNRPLTKMLLRKKLHYAPSWTQRFRIEEGLSC
jgi:hypothetical protein